jgi:myo-inositol-1-phosphate synthase
MPSSKKVKVAIIGVGNCASSLVQGVEYYKDAKLNDNIPGLMHVDIGGYHIRDIEFTAAFDVVVGKVDKVRRFSLIRITPLSSRMCRKRA